MTRRFLLTALLSLAALTAAAAAHAQDPVALQRDAMARFAALDGMWRGPAWTIAPDGSRHDVTQTERVGSLLDGAVKVIEGHGYDAAGASAFNALGIISYDPAARTFSMQSYAMGRAGNFVVTPTEGGFSWEIPAGPMTIRYTATVDGATWREVGERVGPQGEPVRFFEMTLTRIGDTDWPAGGAVPRE